MNKYQNRKNKLKKYKIFLSNNKMNEIISSDKQYINCLKLMGLCEDTAKRIIDSNKLSWLYKIIKEN
jgi:hypothetical protein